MRVLIQFSCLSSLGICSKDEVHAVFSTRNSLHIIPHLNQELPLLGTQEAHRSSLSSSYQFYLHQQYGTNPPIFPWVELPYPNSWPINSPICQKILPLPCRDQRACRRESVSLKMPFWIVFVKMFLVGFEVWVVEERVLWCDGAFMVGVGGGVYVCEDDVVIISCG
jgi:hypothetical protein